MHSSQNEQDNRNYAKFAKVPLLEPSDSAEAKEFLKLAFESERAVRHSGALPHHHPHLALQEHGRTGRAAELRAPHHAEKTTGPSTPCCRRTPWLKHPLVEQRVLDLAEYAETSPLNRMEMGDPRVGIITSGAAYSYAREAFPEASFLKLGMTYPLPERLIARLPRPGGEAVRDRGTRSLPGGESCRSMGITVDGGKNLIPLCGELDPGLVARVLTAAGAPGVNSDLFAQPTPVASDLPGRPPTLCPGCSHRGIFTVLKKLRVFVSGDIGCYTLGALPPFEAMHSCICMGASISMAHGMAQVIEPPTDLKDKVGGRHRRQHLLPLRHHLASWTSPTTRATP